MIQAVIAGVVSTLIAPRLERALNRRPAQPERRPNLSWTTQPWNRLR